MKYMLLLMHGFWFPMNVLWPISGFWGRIEFEADFLRKDYAWFQEFEVDFRIVTDFKLKILKSGIYISCILYQNWISEEQTVP